MWFGADVDEARTVSIGAAWVRADGHAQVGLTVAEGATRPDVGLTVAQAVERLAAMAEKWDASVVLGGPSAAMADDLEQLGVRVVLASSQEFAAASGDVADRLRDGTIHHGNHPHLNDAVQVAQWRSAGVSGERAFRLKDSPGVGPLAAVTRAMHGLNNVAASEPWFAFS